jgi:hypothetical protein
LSSARFAAGEATDAVASKMSEIASDLNATRIGMIIFLSTAIANGLTERGWANSTFLAAGAQATMRVSSQRHREMKTTNATGRVMKVWQPILCFIERLSSFNIAFPGHFLLCLARMDWQESIEAATPIQWIAFHRVETGRAPRG